MRRKTLVACAATIAAASTLVACGADGEAGGAADDGPIHVLVIAATSGPFAVYGEQEILGLQAAADYYNDRGGILGRKVELTVKNDNSSNSTATSVLVQELSKNPDKYSMIWAGETGEATAALAPVLERADVFAAAITDSKDLCATASNCPNLFTMVGSPSLHVQADVEYFKSLGVKKVGAIVDQIEYSLSELKYFKEYMAEAGIEVVETQFPATAVDVTPQMAELKAAEVPVVWAAAIGPTAGYVLKARAALDWEVPVTFDITGSSLDISKLAPRDQLTDVTETIHWCMDPKIDIPAFDTFLKYAKEAPAGDVTCPIVGDSWGGMVFFAEAAEKADSLEPKDLIEAAESLKFDSTDPDFNFISYPSWCWTPENHQNACNSSSDFSVVPVGQLVGTRLQPLS